MNLLKNKSLSKDFLLNIIASFLVTGTSQLILYPKLALELGKEAYGVMLTIIGVINVVTASFGNNLFYARLVSQKDYEDESVKGDYQLFIIISCVLTIIISTVVCLIFKVSINTAIGIILMAVVTVVETYYLVGYRLILDFKNNLFANFFMAFGYVVGAFFLLEHLSWPWIFAFAAILAVIYIFFTNDIMKEPLNKTVLFNKSLKKVCFLIVGGLIGNVSMYLDRFIIFPILGSESVSIYSIASFFAKTFSLLVAPIISVLLSYLTTKKIILNVRKYCLINVIFVILGVAYLILSLTVGKYITRFMYPTIFDDAIPFLLLASIGVILMSIGGFNTTTIIALAPAYWQTVIPAFKLVIYFIIGFISVYYWGMFGFCVGIIITNIIAILVTFFIGLYYVSKENNCEV